MDVRKKQKKTAKKNTFIAMLGLTLSLLIFIYSYSQSDISVVSSKKLVLGTAIKGTLDISVNGFGVLRSNKQTLLTALEDGTVKEILLRPGAVVEKESIILKLDNPELEQERFLAITALAKAKANLRKVKLSNQRELLSAEGVLIESNSAYKITTLRRKAEEQLVELGVVSKIDIKIRKLEESEQKEHASLQVRKLAQLKMLCKENVSIAEEQVKIAHSILVRIETREKQLMVKAGMSGVLQSLSVELGQSVSAGKELALVGSNKDLKALVKVSQFRADLLSIGQTAIVQLRREKVSAVVTRIAPQVENGNVEVELKFNRALPGSAKPEQNVDATINIAKLENTLYIEKPINIKEDSFVSLFRISADTNSAELVEIEFGQQSDKFVQILNGAEENHTFILSDMAHYAELSKVSIDY